MSTASDQTLEPAPDLTIVIPAYNEERRLPATLDELDRHFARDPRAVEILVVDDGSTDGTARVVRERAATRPALRLLALGRNAGKGAAVRAGLAASRAPLRLFTDADLSVPPEHLAPLERAVAAGASVAIGSRAHPDSRIPVPQSIVRRNLGRLFNRLMRALVGIRLADTQCGFKLFTADACERILPLARSDGFAFDVELLALARARGLRVVECPVVWRNDAESKVDIVRHPLAMLAELLAIRRRLRDNAARD